MNRDRTDRFSLLALLLAGAVAPGRVLADEPPAPKIPLSELQRVYETMLPALEEGRRPEGGDQLMMILFGTAAQPLPGWYGPGRSRYDWTWLAARYDANRDGRVTRKEFSGPAGIWRGLDRDGNGSITASDMDWTDQSEFVRQESQVQTRFRALDADDDGRISADEWAAGFRLAAGDAKALDMASFRKSVLAGAGRGGERSYSDLSLKRRFDRLQGILKGDVGSFNEGPQVGELAPDFTLKPREGGEPVTLSSFRGKKPVVLTFGSYTCPPYRALVGGNNELYHRFGDAVQFLAVYVREAHPIDGWNSEGNARAGIEVKQPTSQAERLAVAGKFCEKAKLDFPVLVDEFDDKVGHAYSGMPNRLYLIDVDGKVVYKSGRGPRGYKTAELGQSIELYLFDQDSSRSPGTQAVGAAARGEAVRLGR